jgi:SAM-dependent methyltransferase
MMDIDAPIALADENAANIGARAAALRPAAGQVWDAAAYARNGRFVAELGAPLLEWLAPRAGERVLDLGCGDGVLTEQIAANGCCVIGADASVELVAAARARDIDAQLIDGQALHYHSEFDAVFSNAALHWMRRDPDAVIEGVYRALKPGGRFVAEMGGAGNVAAIRGALYAALAQRGVDAAAVDPWYFPNADEYGARLQAAGFELRRIESFARPTPLPGDVSGWLRTFAQSFLQALPEAEREPLVLEVREALRPILARRIAGAVWMADYVRLRFIAVRPVAA